MDGHIDGAINKRIPARDMPDREVPDRGVSQGGLPDRTTKLELSSNERVEICNEVTPELNRSSPSMTLPYKARTVSSTDSSLRKTPDSFDFRFVASDDEVRQLLMARVGDERRDVTLISHPDDLSQANLVSRLSISEEGRHVLRSGKLFEGSQPLTLVIDIRKLSNEELPKFNNLLDPDNPCLYDKVSQKQRPLGEHVALLVLADPAQLTLVDQRDDASGDDASGAAASGAAAPGADFWRRINRPENTWQFDPQIGNDPSMEIDEVPPLLAELPCAESVMDDDNTVLIDCHLHSHWRQLLLGGPGVDKQGRIHHIPGRLETLRAGQRVILKGANWQDLAFEQTIRQMLARKCFETNGEICQLPDDVKFYQMPVENAELHSLFQSLPHSLSQASNAPGTPIIINQGNIAEWLNPIAIAPEGYAVPNTCLLEQIRAGGAVTVTSPLTEALWFCLLGTLQTIRETTGLEPRLQVAHSKQQPEALGLEEKDEYSIRDHAAFDAVTYQQPSQASHWIKHQQPAPLVIQVNEQTSLSQLFDTIQITSEQKAHCGRRQSELQEAFTAGKPIVLRGLESNPTLQQLLEPLMVGQPLLVNGQLQAYPQAHITLLWPESANSPSSIFSSMVARGKPCPEVDIWDISAVNHGIPRSELPERALHALYEAFKTVPPDLCNPVPELTEGLLNNLILAARRAQQIDQSPQLLPRHWRKAINSVITHDTRQNPAVRDFMKVACWHLLPDAHEEPDQHQTALVDPDRLNAIIGSAPQLDRAFVKQNLWPLARAFDLAVLEDSQFAGLQLSYETPFTVRGEEEILDRLCAIILAHAPEAQRAAIAYQLAVEPAAAEPYQRLAIRPSRQIKRLQDALASGWQLPLPLAQIRSDAIHALASDCFHIARTAHSDAAGIEQIENRLSQSLEWQGSADQPLSALAHDLYHGLMNQKDRESRRLSSLYDRFADSPVIFLQGETGTGKSYFFARMTKVSGQASVISLGPADSEQTLVKRWQWRKHEDDNCSTEQQNRVLMEWANTVADEDGHYFGEKYVTLVLDEANLTKTGLLASLNGLWEAEPCIYVNGHPVRVSSKHRVIITSNPDHDAGCQLDPTVKEKLSRTYSPTLNRAFLRDRVVEPALIRHLQPHLPDHQIDTLAQSATGSVMALWQYYQELLPEHDFTPRDLTDICSWVGWYLDGALPVSDSVTCEQMNGLIQQSFRDVLGPEISETHQDALSVLELRFAARYSPDNTLSNKVHNQTILPHIQQAFKKFTEQTRPDFDTSSSAVSELVQRLGQDLSRCQQAYHLNRKHDGRQATLIEGPTGRGKDATLNLVIESVKRQAVQRGESMPEVFRLNACDGSRDKLFEAIRTAQVDGGIVVISEMNLIDSQHLEGELNDLLAGDAHPGFHLFATINPPGYSGRKPLSPTLKGRFRQLPIRQYSQEELQTIAGKVLPETPLGKTVAEQLTRQHCRLRAELQRKKLPLQLTSLDLQNVARAVVRGGDFSEDGINQCLNQHYRLYLLAARISLQELSEPPALAMVKREPDATSETSSNKGQWALSPAATRVKPGTAADGTGEIKPELTPAVTHSDYPLLRLPQEVFNRIASYLSINDINHFGQTSSTMDNRLRYCGLGEVRHFLSQTGQRQSSCRAIIQSSHILLEYLRTLSIFSVRHFPAQLGPAFYSCYASHMRQQVLDGAALTLMPIGSLNVKDFNYHLRDHIPIIVERKTEKFSDILAPDGDGRWVRKAEIKHGSMVDYGHQRADHILFVPQPVPLRIFRHNYSGKEHLLSVYECKNDSWVEQQLTTGDVFPECEDKYLSNMHLSPDARSLVCINWGRAGAILGQGADGRWVNRGNINTGLNHHLLFSADSKHLALYDGSFIMLMGQADDESWLQTGDINVRDPADDDKFTPSGEQVSEFDFDLDVIFSPDNRHFATWFEDAGEDSDYGSIERDYFFVVIFAYGPEGQWREKERIIEFCSQPSRYFYLKPEFSPDGRLLIITTEDSFQVWELTTDDQWLPSVQEAPESGGGVIHFSVDPCEFIRRSGESVTIWRKAASGIWGQAQSFPAGSLVVISPSGETIVCNDPAGHTDIYQRKPAGELCGEPDGEWINQRIEFPINKADFNEESCLLAVIPQSDMHSLILFGLSADGSWLERTRLRTEGRIKKFCFSPCSRNLQVTSLRPDNADDVTQKVFSLWQIRPNATGGALAEQDDLT